MTPKMVASSSSETLVTIYQATQRNIPEDVIFIATGVLVTMLLS
jgi:hypothetical protein